MIELLLILWNIGLSILLFLVVRCQNNQEQLLYALRDDLNQAKICDGRIVTRYKNGDMKIDLTECPNIENTIEFEK